MRLLRVSVESRMEVQSCLSSSLLVLPMASQLPANIAQPYVGWCSATRSA